VAHHHSAGQKLRPRFTGPWRIQSFCGNNAVRLVNILTGVEEPTLVNVNYLKSARDRRHILAKYWPKQNAETTEAAQNTPAAAAAAENENQRNENNTGNLTATDQLESLKHVVEQVIEHLNEKDEQAVQNVENNAENIAVQQAENSVEPDIARSTPSNDHADKEADEKVEKIIRRQKVQRRWKYLVKMKDSNQEIWLDSSDVPFFMLYQYNQAAAKRRQITRQS
jgi:hypothetical protein